MTVPSVARATASPGGRPTVLVLGVGGNVSQGILKALALSEAPPRVIAACVSPFSAGLHTVEHAYLSPYADDPEFSGWVTDLCRREAVTAVLSGVEPVLERLSEMAGPLRAETGAVAVVAAPDRLAIGADKLATARWLADRGFNHPRSADAADAAAVEELAAELGLPLLAKPRRGKGSAGVMEIADERDLAWVAGRDGYVVQELLGDPDSEFTVACLCDREGVARSTFAMRRRLQSGTTVSAEAGAFPEVTDQARRIATALGAQGPLNVQLRDTDAGPTAFELNVRFSGTAPIRARLGWNDVDAALRHLAWGEELRPLPDVTRGVAVRWWDELYPAPEAVEELAREGRLDS